MKIGAAEGDEGGEEGCEGDGEDEGAWAGDVQCFVAYDFCDLCFGEWFLNNHLVLGGGRCWAGKKQEGDY